MTPGASFYDMGDISSMLKEAASEFGVSREAEIESIEKFCVAMGTTRLSYEGALSLREDGTIAVNDPERLAEMAGLVSKDELAAKSEDEMARKQVAYDPEDLARQAGMKPGRGTFFEGTEQTMFEQDSHDHLVSQAKPKKPIPVDIAASVERAPSILEAVARSGLEKKRASGRR